MAISVRERRRHNIPRPKGGYFVSLDTKRPVALRVVELARGAGLSLTPAGATFPYNRDPGNSNIRISPSRPPVSEIEKAMKVLALCIELASAEYDAKTRKKPEVKKRY